MTFNKSPHVTSIIRIIGLQEPIKRKPDLVRKLSQGLLTHWFLELECEEWTGVKQERRTGDSILASSLSNGGSRAWKRLLYLEHEEHGTREGWEMYVEQDHVRMIFLCPASIQKPLESTSTREWTLWLGTEDRGQDLSSPVRRLGYRQRCKSIPSRHYRTWQWWICSWGEGERAVECYSS